MALINDLASHILRLRFSDLPESVIEVTKRSVLDTVAVTIAGSSADQIEPLVKLAKEWGGREECTIPIYGGKVPAPTAALVNATMTRARDLGDIHELRGGHISEAIIPSAFIISEYSRMFKGKVINGEDFILAVALGSDLLCRIRFAAGKAAIDGAWLADTIAPIAVAAMGGKMLRFDETKLLYAMGIAYAQCSCNSQAYVEACHTVSLQEGFAAKAGVLGMVLADRGFSGAKDILEGEYSLYRSYMRGEFIPDEITNDLGKRFEGANVSIKPYPCCKFTHAAIYGTLQLAREHDLKPNNIERVTISTDSRAYQFCGYGDRKVLPQTVPDAQFSFYYTVATALVKGKVFIDDFTAESIKNREVLTMAQRVKVFVDPKKDKAQEIICPTDIEIETKEGKRYKKTLQFVKGHPANPMNMDDVVQKLVDCSRFAAKPLPSENIAKISQMVKNLSTLDDVTIILGHLT